MVFYPSEKLGLFIDGANLYSASKALDFDLDYKKLLEEFQKRSHLVRAYYYTALIENDDYSPLRPLMDWLDYNGFNVVTKTAREFTDHYGHRRIKGSMDVEMSIDILENSSYLDHIVLFSGDGNFQPLIKAAQRKGCRVSVVSTLKSDPPMISDDVRRQADSFIELLQLRSLIGRKGSEQTQDTTMPLSLINEADSSNDTRK